MKELIKGFTEKLTEGMDKVAEAYDIPEDQHADFIEKVAEELERRILEEGLDKSAGFGADLVAGMGGREVGRSLVGLGATALGGLGALAINKVARGFGAMSNRSGYESALQKAIAGSEILQNDPQKAKRMGDSIFSFAPTVAQDANVLTNILNNAIYGDSIDLQTVRAVTELEEKLKKMKQY